MRQLLVLAIICGPMLFSCKKHEGAMSNNPTDTLATGWKKIFFVHPESLQDIFFINNTGFTISANTIFKSVDGGNNWTMLLLTAPSFVNLGMGSETNAVFVVNPNFLVSTHNGGTTFDTAKVADNHLTDVFFVSPTVAYAAGKSIWKTNDGGLNWTKVYQFTTDSGGYKNLHFLDEQTGWVLRRDGLYATSNGGINWNKVPTNGVALGDFGNVFFRSPSLGFITNEVSFAKTSDAGASWTTTLTGLSLYRDIHFVTDNIGYVTDGSRIYKTTDGGNTWKTEVFLQGSLFVELHFTDANHGWACGSDGTVLTFKQ